MSNIVQARNSVQVSEILIFSTATATPVSVVELPGVLTVVPEESDRLCLSPVSDVRTVSAINEDLVISVSTTYNTEYFFSQESDPHEGCRQTYPSPPSPSRPGCSPCPVTSPSCLPRICSEDLCHRLWLARGTGLHRGNRRLCVGTSDPSHSCRPLLLLLICQPRTGWEKKLDQKRVNINLPSVYLVISRLEICCSLHALIPSKSRENKNMVFLMIDISK